MEYLFNLTDGDLVGQGGWVAGHFGLGNIAVVGSQYAAADAGGGLGSALHPLPGIGVDPTKTWGIEFDFTLAAQGTGTSAVTVSFDSVPVGPAMLSFVWNSAIGTPYAEFVSNSFTSGAINFAGSATGVHTVRIMHYGGGITEGFIDGVSVYTGPVYGDLPTTPVAVGLQMGDTQAPPPIKIRRIRIFGSPA